jgi:hypothetical protein
MEKYDFNFNSEYYQFYVLDAQTKASTDATDFWCPEADARRLAIGEGLLGVTIATYGGARGSLLIKTQKPDAKLTADHIVEASIRIPSGILQIKNCTGYETQLEVKITKGTYRIRISSHHLSSVNGDEGEDFYTLEMWQSRFAKPVILKAYRPA